MGTIELLSKYLLPKDKLSITTFDTDVKQIFQLSEMTSQNKQNVEAVIKNVKAGSSTNLSGGLMDAIGDCLGGIMSVVAQNIVLEARPAVEGVAINNCFEENREVKISEDGIYRISFGDMYAGERRDTIFKIDVDPCRCPETNAPLVTFKLKYLDAINESMSESEVTCTVNRVEDNEVNTNLTNKSVSSQVVRAVIGKALSEANTLADQYKFKEAKEILEQGLKFA